MSGFQTAERQRSQVVGGWTFLDPAAVDDQALAVCDEEYTAIERGGAPESALGFAVDEDTTAFEAVQRMKMLPLVLSEAEAQAFAAKTGRRARRIAKPLPLE